MVSSLEKLSVGLFAGETWSIGNNNAIVSSWTLIRNRGEPSASVTTSSRDFALTLRPVTEAATNC